MLRGPVFISFSAISILTPGFSGSNQVFFDFLRILFWLLMMAF